MLSLTDEQWIEFRELRERELAIYQDHLKSVGQDSEGWAATRDAEIRDAQEWRAECRVNVPVNQELLTNILHELRSIRQLLEQTK